MNYLFSVCWSMNPLAEPLQWVALTWHSPAATAGATLPPARICWPWPSCPSSSKALLPHGLHGNTPASTGSVERESLKTLNKLDAKSKPKQKEGEGEGAW